MSQITHLVRVRHHGAAVFLGHTVITHKDGTVANEPRWSSNGEAIAAWLAAGFRTRFNQRRSCRSQYLTCKDREGQHTIVADPAGEPVLVSLGRNVVNMSDKQARAAFPYLAAMPSPILQATEKIEAQDWFSAIKRRSANLAQGRKAGRMPRFRSAKKDDARFTCWFNGGHNAVFTKTGKRSGIVTISGMNPRAWKQPGMNGQCWRVDLHVRLSQPIRDYTSIRVNLTRRELVFVNAPLAVTERSEHPVHVGIDRGVAHTLALSDGTFRDAPDTSKLERKRKAYSRRMAKSRVIAKRQHRPFYVSRRYQENKAAAAKWSRKIERIRTNFAHTVSTELVREHDVIVVEKLKLANMTRRAKGKGRAAKTGLNRVLQNAALGRMGAFLAYKAKLAGVQYAEVNPDYTSQRCNECGHTCAENRESQAVFMCIACGHIANADSNAARNILRIWEVSTGQDYALAGSGNKSRDVHASRAATSNREPFRLVAV